MQPLQTTGRAPQRRVIMYQVRAVGFIVAGVIDGERSGGEWDFDSSDSRPSTVLVPWLDLLNHSSEAGVLPPCFPSQRRDCYRAHASESLQFQAPHAMRRAYHRKPLSPLGKHSPSAT